jgi:hypothetical protein
MIIGFMARFEIIIKFWLGLSCVLKPFSIKMDRKNSFFGCIVKPVYNGHPWDPKKAALYTGDRSVEVFQ